MKNIYLSILIIPILLCCGCTQNNGHLGALFGSWTLSEIDKDGEIVEKDKDDTVFSFQSSIVEVAWLTEPPYTTEYRYGNFTHEGDKLTMQFQSDDSGHSNMYKAPYWIFFPQDGKPIIFDVMTLKSDRMTLKLNIEGSDYIYKFRKTM